ncbi:MAG: hypothetical protein J6K61_05500 [Clostridia bacterium]|nr:hypothetical protein [Clostridia bacterium]
MRLKEIFSFLPQGLCALLDAWGEAEGVAELRLRAEKVASLSLYREGRTQNILLPFTATYGHIQEIVERLCGGSVYAHEDSIRQGYIKLSNGCRVGLGGEGVTENGRLLRLLRVTFLVFRLPKRVPGAAAAVLRAFRRHGCQSSALVIAPRAREKQRCCGSSRGKFPEERTPKERCC